MWEVSVRGEVLGERGAGGATHSTRGHCAAHEPSKVGGGRRPTADGPSAHRRRGARQRGAPSETPFQRERGVDNRLVGDGKIVAHLDFRAHRETKIGIHPVQLVEVEPKLRFGDENHIVFPVAEVAIAPHVGKTAERHGTGGEVAIPRARELPGIGLRLLGQVLVHGRNREAGVVRRGVPSVGHADEIGIVVAEFVAQAAVVLNVGGEGRFAQRELA